MSEHPHYDITVMTIIEARVATKILQRFWGWAADTESMILLLLSGLTTGRFAWRLVAN